MPRLVESIKGTRATMLYYASDTVRRRKYSNFKSKGIVHVLQDLKLNLTRKF